MLFEQNWYVLKCFLRSLDMTGSSGLLGASSEQNVIGPDYFGLYTREVAEFFSQDEDFVPVSPNQANLQGKASGICRENSLTKNSRKLKEPYGITGSAPAPLFCDGIGSQLSDFKKESLRSLVRQSLFAFTKEVDEMLNPVLRICRIQSLLRYKKGMLNLPGPPCESNGHHPQKKHKIDDDLQVLLENDSTKIEEIMKKHSDDLLAMIVRMEQKLEEFLDILISQCRRLMTLAEKQKLRKMIQDLPRGNLDRVVEIFQHGRKLDTYSCDEIYVDLETENNVTLWRLYYYAKAVENAWKLREGTESF